MSEFTIFTIAKPMRLPRFRADKLAKTTYNNQDFAIWSWQRLPGDPEVIVYGDAPGVKEWLARYHPNVRHITGNEQSADGLGRTDSVFQLAQQNAANDLLLFCNADIILPPETHQALQMVDQNFDRWLMTGGRINMRKSVEWKRGPDWWPRVRHKSAIRGNYGGPYGMDYFGFRRGQLFDMPELYVGRWFWDTAMIKLALDAGYTIVDSQPALPVVHQWHDYNHVKGGLDVLKKDEFSAKNREAIGGAEHMYPYNAANDGHVRLVITTDNRWEFEDIPDELRDRKAKIDF